MRTGKTKNGVKTSSLEGITPKAHDVTWILVAHRAGARLFASQGKKGQPELTKEIPFPEGKLKNRETGGDRPGRTFDSHISSHHGQTGGPRHALGGESSPQIHFEERFAADLAECLKQGRVQASYHNLILVAEPRLLGFLRAALDSETRLRITREVEKDFSWVSTPDLSERLRELLTGNTPTSLRGA